jgi:putative NADH-flavin reductase
MKLIVFGATGGTGRQVVAQALSAGHTVTAVARRPDILAIRHERLTVVGGDVLEPATLAQPLVGQDAVVSALGIRNGEPTTLYSAGLANIMHAMQLASVRRLICISAGGLDPGPGIARWLAKTILWRLLRDSYIDMTRMEAEVKASDLDWTIVQAPMLTDKPHRRAGSARHRPASLRQAAAQSTAQTRPPAATTVLAPRVPCHPAHSKQHRLSRRPQCHW